MTAPALTLTVKIDEKAWNAYLKRLDKNRGKPLLTRAEKTINSAAKLMVPALSDALPASGRSTAARAGPIAIIGAKRRRTMKKSAGTKLLRKQGGEAIRPTWIGVKHFAFRWLTEGTSTHGLQTRGLEVGAGGRFTGRGNWRSGFAHFARGEVRPLASIADRGTTGRDYISSAREGREGQIMTLIQRDTFDVK